MTTWYDSIEPGVREVVRLLRDNGINTTHSCEHTMEVEAEAYESADIARVYDLLIEDGHDGFTIILAYYKQDGWPLLRRLTVQLTKENVDA